MERSFAGLPFSYVESIRPECDERGDVTEDMPQARFCNERNLLLHKYGEGPFCWFRIAQEDRWQRSGIYILTCGGDPRYIGECQNLAQRWGPGGYGRISPRACYSGGQQTNCRINNLIYRGAKSGVQFDLWFHPIESDKQVRRVVESKLVATLEPPWNR